MSENNSKRLSSALRMVLVEYLLGWIVSLCPADDKAGVLLLGYLKGYFDAVIPLRKKLRKEDL